MKAAAKPIAKQTVNAVTRDFQCMSDLFLRLRYCHLTRSNEPLIDHQR